MSQSSLLVGLLAAAFILFVAARGRLPIYTGVLWGPAPKASGGGSGGDGGGSGGGSGGTLDTAISIGEHVLPMFLGA